MVVQHNMQAMNANRQLNITTGNQGKSTEKLSSGYKINRAADDAAGLSISEKMRRQIRGLDRASTNAQDGISSVQTAEGALNEVHDMLQRMNELANQASNGTNSASDRQSIQDEISQLNTEIDRVAETTKFNELYLLKGDAGTKEITLKGHDAGINGSLSDQGTTAKFEVKLQSDSDISISSHNYHIYEEGDEVSTLQDKVDDADQVIINGTTYTRTTEKAAEPESGPTVDELTDKINDLNSKQAKLRTSITALEKCVANKKTSVNAKKTCATQKQTCIEKKQGSVQSLQASSSVKTGSAGSLKGSVAAKKAELSAIKEAQAEKQEAVDKDQAKIDSKNAKIDELSAEIDAAMALLDDDDDSNDEAATETINNANTTISELRTSVTALEKCAANKKTSVNAKKTCATQKQTCIEKKEASIKAKEASAKAKTGSANSKQGSAAAKMSELSGIKDAQAEKQEAVDKDQSKIDSKQEQLDAAQKEIEAAMADLEKLINGETIEVVDNTAKSATFVSDDKEYQLNDVKALIVDGAKVGFGDSKARTAVDLSVNRNNITVDEAKDKIKNALLQANQIGADDETAVKVGDAKDAGNDTYSFEITKGSVTVAKEKSFELHVGADADLTNKITVNIETMNSKYLGVQNLNVVDDSGIAATYAIDAIEDALTKVSEQRSALGAVQNRLEHTITNLDNVVENTQSAESGIRDTDIADEMVRYSKNNILSQAGQSMLAQANQSTQGALSLLG